MWETGETNSPYKLEALIATYARTAGVSEVDIWTKAFSRWLEARYDYRSPR